MLFFTAELPPGNGLMATNGYVMECGPISIYTLIPKSITEHYQMTRCLCRKPDRDDVTTKVWRREGESQHEWTPWGAEKRCGGNRGVNQCVVWHNDPERKEREVVNERNSLISLTHSACREAIYWNIRGWDWIGIVLGTTGGKVLLMWGHL